MLGAMKLIQEKLPAASAKMVLPNEALKELADRYAALPPNVEIQIGNLPQALAEADVAIASTGTVTMECAFFGVPTVTLYKTSWFNYQIARRIVTVKSATMPNMLADEEVYPEFIQNAATPENISRAALELLQNESRRQQIKSQLAKIISSLGEPGASPARGGGDFEFVQHRHLSRLVLPPVLVLAEFFPLRLRGRDERTRMDFIMKDLTNPTWIKMKGLLFLLIGIAAAILIFLDNPNWKTAVLLALAIWSFCRFYYFAFYVIGKYVDPGYKFSGLISFVRYWFRRR